MLLGITPSNVLFLLFFKNQNVQQKLSFTFIVFSAEQLLQQPQKSNQISYFPLQIQIALSFFFFIHLQSPIELI